MFLPQQPARKLKVIITTVRLATIKYIANNSWLKLRYYNFLKIEKLKDLKKIIQVQSFISSLHFYDCKS